MLNLTLPKFVWLTLCNLFPNEGRFFLMFISQTNRVNRMFLDVKRVKDFISEVIFFISQKIRPETGGVLGEGEGHAEK